MQRERENQAWVGTVVIISMEWGFVVVHNRYSGPFVPGANPHDQTIQQPYCIGMCQRLLAEASELTTTIDSCSPALLFLPQRRKRVARKLQLKQSDYLPGGVPQCACSRVEQVLCQALRRLASRRIFPGWMRQSCRTAGCEAAIVAYSMRTS